MLMVGCAERMSQGMHGTQAFLKGCAPMLAAINIWVRACTS
ncbi:hypothetical protein JCM19237_5276 [Photobacterium aphoticum]|uniref:Uncharacterized protein n=1 Tax=Photobacterium aphoticum TaxID=754436 RepID=A0A090QJE9_9GAMM|nr:hypothetical protein JCM19237_5276 [Photobacterium aphoticum]